jgi:trypsin/pre-peptidase
MRRPARAALGFAALCLSTVLAPPRVRAAVPELGAPRIVNGNFTQAYPSVGALLTPSGTNAAGTLCSGTLIGCQTFLTAAHCVCDSTGMNCQSGVVAPNPDDYVVFLQNVGFVAVSSIDVNPEFDFPVGDVALLHLAQPVTGVRPTPINATEQPSPAEMGEIVGFGRSGGSANDYGLKRVGAIETASCFDDVSNVTSVCWDFRAPLGAPGTDSDTCNGDSGGPLLLDFGTGPLVAGTTSGGFSASCHPLDHSFDANVFHYRAYIQAKGGADLANTSCGGVPQVGDPETPVRSFSGTLSPVAPQAVHSFDVGPGVPLLRVTMNASEQGGNDFNLYVKYGSPPTTIDFDCKASGPSQYGACEFTSPAAGTWYAAVAAFSGSGAYQLTATIFGGACGPSNEGLPCDDDNACTSGETCQGGACIGIAIADGTPCDDGRACTSDDRCAAGACIGSETPLATCKQVTVTRASSLTLRNVTPDSKDEIVWTWKRGEATSIGDFGTPTTSSAYDFCLFDESGGTPSLVEEAHIPPGPGWSATKPGFRYRDPSGTNGGIESIVLRSGSAGAASVGVLGRGANLTLPTLPLQQSPSVTAQLVGPNACFSATFSSDQVNTSALFRARSD